MRQFRRLFMVVLTWPYKIGFQGNPLSNAENYALKVMISAFFSQEKSGLPIPKIVYEPCMALNITHWTLQLSVLSPEHYTTGYYAADHHTAELLFGQYSLMVTATQFLQGAAVPGCSSDFPVASFRYLLAVNLVKTKTSAAEWSNFTDWPVGRL